MNRTHSHLLTGLAVIAGLNWGCNRTEEFAAPPPLNVEVGNAIVEDTRVYLTFPGRAEAYSRVEIRARVKGFLQSCDFQAGDYIEEGTTLFTIEPDQFEAARKTAEAQLARANADLDLAKINAERMKTAFQSQAVSAVDKDTALADVDLKTAQVQIETASLDDAKRDLDYATVTAPISGRVSRSLVDQGNLVGANEPTLLTTMTQDRPIYFNFEAGERAVVPYLPNLPDAENPSMAPRRPEDSELELILADGTLHTVKVADESTDDPNDTTSVPELGKIEFVDNTISNKTGTIRLRAEFENKDGNILDGAFGRIRIPQEVVNAVKVPQAVVQRDLGGNFVLLVGEGNVVERRVVIPTEYSVEIKVGEYLEEFRIIEAYDEGRNTGVKADELIIMNNLQRARPGLEVKPRRRGEGATTASDQTVTSEMSSVEEPTEASKGGGKGGIAE
ncbi:MAG: efflux RND transporter periplasmic adaptor subunit [Verrucomicrobiales bacterium]